MTVLGAAALVLACGGPATTRADEAKVYAALLADPEMRDPAACGILSDPDLRGDCGVVVAERRMAEGTPVEGVCAGMEHGVWADECRFRAAEESMRSGDPDTAARLCLSVERFRNACAQHLWDPELAGVWHGPDVGGALERGRVLHAAWARRLDGATDLDDRFWRHWFRLGFVHGVPLPADADAFCAEVPRDLAGPCLKAVGRAIAEARGNR